MKLVVSKHKRSTGEVIFSLNLVDCALNSEFQITLYQGVLDELNAKIVKRSLLGFDGFVNDYLIGTSMIELSDTNWGVDVESTDENVINQIKALMEERIKLIA